jgi:hypothetical protein
VNTPRSNTPGSKALSNPPSAPRSRSSDRALRAAPKGATVTGAAKGRAVMR